MRRESTGGREGRGRSRQLGMLMFGAFLAGLLVVGVAFLLSGQGKAPSPLASSPVAQAPSARPAQALPPPPSPPLPRLAIVVDGLGYDSSPASPLFYFPLNIH